MQTECLRFVRIGNQLLVIFSLNNYHKYTTHSVYYFNREVVKGRRNFYNIKRGREQKSLGSSGLEQCLSTFFEIVHTFNFYLKACTPRSSQHNTLKLHQC